MRITFPMLSLGPSGGSRVIADLANGLKKKGHDVVFVVPKGADRDLYPLHVNIIATGASLEKKGFYFFRALIVFWEIIFAIPRSDIICATAGVTSLIVIIAAKIFGKGTPVYFIQGLDHLYLESRTDLFARFMIKKSYKWFDNLVFVSEKLRRATAVTGKRNIVIHPGINKAFKPYLKKIYRKADSPSILWVGRKFRIKGLGDMLKAFKIILKTKKKAKLMIISPDKIDIRGMKNISVKSFLSTTELARAYARADVFVSTSIFEGLGLPPLEAMASGTPVVTTDSVGVMEYAKNRVNALVVPPSEPQKAAEAILNILEDDRLARKIVKGGLKTAKEFNWDITVDKFDRFFKRVVIDRRHNANV
jgi:glycosyltransferase involved in cell wall biosynthesis